MLNVSLVLTMLVSTGFFILRTRLSPTRAVLKGPHFFFAKDRPKGPPTANRQVPSTANRHQPPTTNRQPPTAANRQRRPTANCQPLPTATNHQSPTTNHRQPPPTATNNRQTPPAMVEHMECPQALLGKLVPGHFFFPLRTALSPTWCGKVGPAITAVRGGSDP